MGLLFCLILISPPHEDPTSLIKGKKVKKGGLLFSSHDLVFYLLQ